MKTTIIFIHGTGVREPQYTQTFKQVSQMLTKRNSDLNVLPCYWGGKYGTSLHANGASIPQYESTRTLVSEKDKEAYLVALWELLYQDPLYELRLLSLRKTGQTSQFIPGQLSPGEALHERTKQLSSSLLTDTQSSDRQILENAGIMPLLGEASTIITKNAAFHDALRTASEQLEEYNTAIARAIVAQAIILAENQALYPPITTNAILRDEVIEILTKQLGSSTRGIITDWLKKQLLGLGTRYIESHRASLPDISDPRIGDLLFYQSKGKYIRQFIRDQIANSQEPVVLLSHSLGGIACVELLAELAKSEQTLCDKVKLLVTAGSQAPYLYEINALQVLPFQDINADERLPPNFPQWLNIYDMRDFLSYIGAGIFGHRVTDLEVDNKQPFPRSHSAYWTNDTAWDAIIDRIKQL